MAHVSETAYAESSRHSAPGTSESIFEVCDVVYEYTPGVAALDGVSLAIPCGQRVAILGANGSGKSTLIRLLDGLYFPAKGSVAFGGTPLTEEKLQEEAFAFDFRRRVALVFQNPDVQLLTRPFLTRLRSVRCNCAGRRMRFGAKWRRCWSAWRSPT